MIEGWEETEAEDGWLSLTVTEAREKSGSLGTKGGGSVVEERGDKGRRAERLAKETEAVGFFFGARREGVKDAESLKEMVLIGGRESSEGGRVIDGGEDKGFVMTEVCTVRRADVEEGAQEGGKITVRERGVCVIDD